VAKNLGIPATKLF